MEVKKITEGMTAPQVAQVIDDNFKAQNAILEEDIANQNNVIGVSEYKDFSEAEAANVGDVRKYNGFLYECVEATTGAFDASKWKKSSFKAETEKKLSELGLQNTIKGNLFRDLSSMNVFEGQMTGENKFYISDNVITSHFVVPVKAEDTINITASTSQPCVYALLRDYVTAKNGEPILLADGESRKVIGNGQSASFVVSEGVKYIAFNYRNGANIFTPSSFVVNGFDFADSIFSRVVKIEDNPFVKGYNEKIVTNESKGFYYAESSIFTANEGYSTTDYIEVGSSQIKAKIAVPYSVNAITCFDEDKIVIGGVIGKESGLYLSEYNFIPEEHPSAKFIRITSRSTVEGYYSEYIKTANNIIEDIYKEKRIETQPICSMPSFNRFLGHSELPTMGKGYQMFVCYGQSFSDGSDSLFVSDDAVPNTYMLSNIEGNGKELKPLVLKGNKQHPIVSCVNSFSSLYQSYFGKKKFIASSVGVGGRSIAQLSKKSRIEEYANEYDYSIKDGGRYESVFLRAIDNAVSVVGYNNIECPAIIYMQGERDYVTDSQAPDAMPGSADSAYSCGGDKELYKKRMLDLKNDMQADIMEKFGQSTKPIFCIYQVSGTFIRNNQMTINMAQLEFAQENDDVYLMPSPYFAPDYGAHLSTNGYRWYGEFLAKALIGILCNRSYWKPLLPYQFKIDGSKICVSIENNVGKLEFDSSLVELSTNYGFAVFVDGIYSANNIESVTIDDNHVIIDCNQDLIGKSIELVYGGNKTNGSGNVRDNDVYRSMYNYWDDSSDKGSSGELTIKYRPNIIGKKYPMYNWLSSFYKKIQ